MADMNQTANVFRRLDWAVLMGLVVSAGVARGYPNDPPAEPSEEPGRLRYVEEPSSASAPGKALAQSQGEDLKSQKAEQKRQVPQITRPSGRAPARRGVQQPTADQGRPGEPVQSRVNLDAANMDRPAEERNYVFSIVNGTYKELVENFGRMSGLPVLGEAPSGVVTFVSDEEMDFKSALTRVRLLLFKYSAIEPYWLLHKQDAKHLEVLRVTDIWRYIELDHIFMDLASFEAADIDDNELAMLQYTPTDTSVAQFAILRDFMPDYVRIAPLEGTNSLAIFALVKDIKKYLELIRLFEGAADDPRVLEKLAVGNIAPSQAVETLRLLMDELNEAGQVPGRPRAVGDQGIVLPGQRTIMFPDDAQGVIVVRAVPKQITEIKTMLDFIDVNLGVETNPVLIPIQHAKVDDLVIILQPLIAKGTSAPIAPAAGQQTPAQKRRAQRNPKLAGQAGGGALGEEIMLLPVARTNTLVVVGSEGEIEYVRHLVTLFDVPLTDGGPVFMELQNADASQLAILLPQVITAGKAKGGDPFNAVAEPGSNVLILIGGKEDVETAKSIIAKLDVPTEPQTMHSYQMVNGSPQAVVDLMALVDSQGGTVLPPGGKGRRSRTPVAAAGGGTNVHIDEVSKTIYVMCTEHDWVNKYLPLIKQAEDLAADPAGFARIALNYITAEEAIVVLNPLVSGRAQSAASLPKLSPAGNAVLMTDASPAEIAQIRAILAEIDQPTDGRAWELFEIRFADPAAIQTILQSGVVGGQGRPPGSRQPAAGGQGLVVSVVGQTMAVSGLPEELKEAGAIIAQLDVETADNALLRSYHVPRGLDVQEIATQLDSIVTGAPTGRRPGAPPIVGSGDVRIVAQSVARRILVNAPEDAFVKIEEALALLLEGDAPDAFELRFFALQYVSAESIAPLIEPVLKNREQELRATGGVSEASDPKQRAMTMQGTSVMVSSDIQGERLMVTAPKSIMPEVEALIGQLDKPDSRGDRIMRVITLTRSTPDQVIEAVGALLSGGVSKPSPRRPRVKTPGTAAALTQVTDEVTVAAAPGGGSVIVSGFQTDVDQVERWIRDLDSGAQPEQTIKIYHIKQADLEQLADSIIALCDAPGQAQLAKQRVQEEGFDFFEASTGIRNGTEITLSIDYVNRIIIARATPAKIYEIDTVVNLYDPDDPEDIGLPPRGMPILMYELQHADAFDASSKLDSVLKTVWPYGGDSPDVDYISGTKILVVKCLPEHNSFVEEQIRQFVDKESDKAVEVKREFISVSNVLPSELAAALKMRMPDINVELERIGEDLPPIEELKAYRPCVIPQSLIDAIGATSALAMSQAAAESEDGEAGANQTEESATEEAKRSAAAEMIRSISVAGGNVDSDVSEAATESAPPPSPPLRVRFDDRGGVVAIEGSPREVDEVKEVLESIMDEFKSMSTKPDIRVFRIRYRDVNVAADILANMFGAVRAQQAQQRGVNPAQQQLQVMRQQMQLQRLQQQMAQRGQQPGGQPQLPIDPKTGLPMMPGEEGAEEETKQVGTGEIRIHPDPQLRAIIVKASTEDFPIIVDLLATIDRPADVTNKHRIFKLTKLKATDVEGQLKVLLGITQDPSAAGARRMPVQRGRGQQQAGVQQQLEDALLNLNLGAIGEGAINASSDIVITSNEQANTLLVMAPEAAIELIAKLIEELEAQEIPVLVTRTYVFRHADATSVAVQLKEIFGVQSATRASAEEFDPNAVNQATFAAESRTNTLIVRALDVDFDKIEPIIKELDKDLGQQQAVITVQLKNADALAVASTMNNAYGGGTSLRGGGQPIKFVGDAGSNTILIIAPEPMRQEVTNRIAEMDDLAGGLAKPRVIKLALGSAEEIARTLQDVFQSGSQKNDAVKIIGDESSKQIFVSAPDDVFLEIERLARGMDQPSTNIDVRSFPLTHAKAVDVYEKLMTMVQQLGRQVPKSALDVFTAVADDRTNSIVVLGGPTSFLLMQKALGQIDVEPSEQAQIVTAIYQLVNANASELARNINTVYGAGRGRGGEGTTAEANQSNNSIIVRGPNNEVDEIYAKMIKPLEEQAMGSARQREIVTLEHGEAAEIARLINDELNRARPGQKREGQQPMAVIANESMNSLIISGSQNDIADVVALAKTMDVKPAMLKERETRVYSVLYADINSLTQMLQNMYRKQRGQRPEDEVEVGQDRGTSKLVITATPEILAEIERTLGEIDVESTIQRREHVVKLKYANAQELARNLDTMFRQNIRTQQGQPAMTIFGDLATNSLIVYANDEELGRVSEIVRALDISSEEAGSREIRSFVLANTSPWTIADAIRQIYRPQGRQANPRDEVIAVPEGTAMSVIVSASPEKMEEIAKVVAEFDKPGASDSDVHVVEIKTGDAESIVQALQPLFVTSGGRDVRGQATVQISSPRGTNMVVIKANERKYEQVLETIQMLDTASAELGEIEVIALKHTDAEMMQEALESYLQKPGQQRGRGAELMGDVRVMSNPLNNTMVISGDVDEVARLKATIAKLDVEIEGATTAPRIIALRHARASIIEPVLTQMFVEGTSGRGRGGRGSSGVLNTPVIAADEHSNTLIIRASASDFGMIDGLIAELDSEKPEDQVSYTIIPVAEGINLEDMAQTIETTINQGEQIRAQNVQGMDPGSVVITSDRRAHALVVTGTPTLFPDVRLLVDSLSGMGSSGGMGIRSIKLMNMSPDEVSRLLERVIQENSQSPNQAGGRSPSRPAQPTRRPTQPSNRRPPVRRG